jgi:hypothetical protein
MPANYDNVNATWPEDAPVPTPQEAIAGARKLVRLAAKLGGPTSPQLRTRFKWQATSGNRSTWPRAGVFYVNPDEFPFGGWKDICHGISHWAGRRLFPDAKPHDARTAFIERTLAEHVVASGWLDGKLRRQAKPKPTGIELRAHRYQATLAASSGGSASNAGPRPRCESSRSGADTMNCS